MLGSEAYDQLYDAIAQGLDIEESIKRMSQLPTVQHNELAQHDTLNKVIDIVSEVLEVNKEEIVIDLELSQMGFDEVSIEKFLSSVNHTFSVHIHQSEINAFKTLQEVSEMIQSQMMHEDEMLQEPLNESYKDEMAQYLKKQLAKMIKMDPYRISDTALLEKYGVDSIVMMDWIEMLRDTFGELPQALMFEYQTIEQLVLYFLEEHTEAVISLFGKQASTAPVVTAPPVLEGQQEQVPVSTDKSKERVQPQSTDRALNQQVESYHEDIAIIGMAGRFPQSPSIKQFFENLLEGKDLVTAVTKDRWDMEAYQDKICCHWGGFLEDIDQFDPLLFGILPMEAPVIDPMSRLFLETVYTLMDSTGYTKKMLTKQYDRQVGVYVGAMYQQYQLEQGNIEQEAITSVNSFSSIANRISYYYDFQGPSIAIDTMCSSSSVAIHMACESLKHNECKLAIAGGVNLSINPKKYVGLTQSGVLASQKESRSFAKGDGYIPCEGVGAILLKPLGQAVADGDEVIAVIKATSVNHNGHTNGYMVPSQVTQKKLMEENFKKCHLTPDSISYVEAAANGSPLGDAIEIDALTKFYTGQTDKTQSCAIGSVKSNMGHPEAVSGIAQIAKVALQLKNKVMVPSIYLETPNPNIHLENSPFYFVKEKQTWQQPFKMVDGVQKAYPRRAVIDSIGAGGTNVNMILEEYCGEESVEDVPYTKISNLFVFSANTKERLQEVIRQMMTYIKEHPQISLPRLAYTLQNRKEIKEVKLAIISHSVEDLILKLEHVLEQLSMNKSSFEDGIYMTANEQEIGILQHLFTGKIKDKLIQLLMEEKSLDQIAFFFVNSSDITFDKFYSKVYQPIKDLPTYPFQREGYWIGKKQNVEPKTTKEKNVATHLEPSDQIAGAVNQLIESYSGVPTAQLSSDKTLGQYGFNSIQLFNLKSELEKKFHVEVPVTLLSSEQNIKEIITYISNLHQMKRVDESLLPVITASGQERYVTFPLNDIQESFYIGRKAKFSGDAVGAHIYFEFKMKHLDIQKLNDTWNRLVKYHSCLHTKLLIQGEQQEAELIDTYRFKVLDLQREEANRITKQLEIIREKLAHKVYDVEDERYYEIRVSLLPNHEAIVHFSIDEFIVDATSIQILLQQWRGLYEGSIKELPEAQVTFRDYVLALKQFEKSQRYQGDLSYWVKRLQNMPSGPQLPRDKDTSQINKSKRKRYQYKFGQEKWKKLQDKANEKHISTTVLILTLFGEFLKQETKQATFSLLLTYYNRLPIHEDIESMVGPLISTNIFVVEDNDESLEVQMESNQKQLFMDLDHNTVSGIRILRELKQQKITAKELYLPVVFTSLIHNFTSQKQKDLPTFFTEIDYMVTQTPQVFLDHQLYEEQDQLVISWDIAYEYFGEQRTEALFKAYCDFIHGYIGIEQEHPPYPLTDMQYAYAYGRNTEVKSISNCQFYQEIDFEQFDPQRFQAAWQALVMRHPMLRTKIYENGMQQTMSDVEAYKPYIHNLCTLSQSEREYKLEQIKNQISRAGFKVNSWPFFNVEIALMPGEKARVFLAIDMLVADGLSMQILIEQLLTMYATNEVLPSLAYTFEEYVKTSKLAREDVHNDKAYWEEKFSQLSGGPVLHEEALLNSNHELKRAHKKAIIDGWQYLQQEATKRQVSKSSVLFTAYAEVIAHYMHRQSFSIVVPSWNRPNLHPEINEVVGDFTQMSWIPVNSAPNQSFMEKLYAFDCIQKADLSHKSSEAFKALRKAVLRKRKNLEFPVVFTDLFPSSGFKLPQNVTMGTKISNTPSVYLDNISQENGNQLIVQWDGVFEIFKPGLISQMFKSYVKVLKALCSSHIKWEDFQIEEVLAHEIVDDK